MKYIEKSRGQPLKVLPVKDKHGNVLFSIKYYLLFVASGEQSEPIYIIADDNMGEEDIDIYKVPELAVHTNLESTGYVVFCKSRACNKAFYKWFNKDILLPFIDVLRAKCIPDDARSVACFQLDGESTQIDINYANQENHSDAML